MSQASDHHQAIDGALEAIDVFRWGPKKINLLARVRRRTLGDPRVPAHGFALIALREFVEATGLDRRRAYDLVEEMVGEGVLLREEGGGSRSHAYRINPDLAEWDVPWNLPAQVAVGRAYNPVSFAPARGHKPRFAARQSAPLGEFVARQDAPQNDGCGATDRAASDPVVARQTAPQTGRHLRAVSSSLIEDSRPPSDEEDDEHPNTTAVKDAIRRRSGSPIRGKFLARVSRAVDHLEPADLAYVIGEVDRTTGLGFALLVDVVEAAARDVLRTGDESGGPRDPRRSAVTLAENRKRGGFTEDDVRDELESKYPPDVVEEALAVFRHTREAQ